MKMLMSYGYSKRKSEFYSRVLGECGIRTWGMLEKMKEGFKVEIEYEKR